MHRTLSSPWTACVRATLFTPSHSTRSFFLASNATTTRTTAPPRTSISKLGRTPSPARSKHTNTARTAFFEQNNNTTATTTTTTTPTKSTDHPHQHHHHQRHKILSNTSSSSTSSPAPSSSSSPKRPSSKFENRLQFLLGSVHRYRHHHHNNNNRSGSTPTVLPPPPTYLLPTSRTVQRRVFGKRYRPGFQKGDFICPQCGSHNFRPPDHTQIAPYVAARRRNAAEGGDCVEELILKGRGTAESTSKAGKSAKTPLPLSSSSSPSPSSSSSSSSSSTTATTATTPTTTITTPLDDSIDAIAFIRPSARSRDLKVYPQGSFNHCFECGFQSTFENPFISSSSTPTTPRLSVTGSKKDHLTKQDLRISKPRDYICGHCQTVNYGGRIHCVGCGLLAPWIKDMVERGPPQRKQ